MRTTRIVDENLGKKILPVALFLMAHLLFINPSQATPDIYNRLGVGFSRQLKTEVPAISVKIQKTQTLAIGAMLGFKNSDQGSGGGYGAGLKVYRNLFAEPMLRFYSSLMVGLVSRKTATVTQSGMQIDGTFGSEFHFPGIESLGFSFEFGLSLNKIGGVFNIETVGNHFLVAGVHFYL